jgi:hypothetical protein
MKLKMLLLAFGLLTVAGACAGEEVRTVGRVTYTITRSWSNGMVEKAEVYGNGAVVMEHGDYTEKLRLPEDQLAQLRAAAEGGVAPGNNSDDPVIGVTVSGSDEVRPAALTEGSLADLLNRLLNDHTLNP